MKDDRAGVAIVGMACIFPGARDLASFWRNLSSGFDAITDAPAERWDPVFYDPSSKAVDRLYCRRGGFVGEHALFDASRFGVMPVAVGSAEPDQLLALQVASDALADAGYGEGGFPRDRASVILGRGNYYSSGMVRHEQQVRVAEQIAACLRALTPELDEERLSAVKAEFQAALGAPAGEGGIGLVPNLAASRIANRLDLRGAAYTVDAACASSLVALDHACRELLEGRSDLALAGGVHLGHEVSFWSVFCQLGALSRSQQIRPFDRRADGILIGEGIGVVVLKRLADAMRDDDRIYAVIRGTGVASDGRAGSLMSPAPEGQVLALERAWCEAGLDPATIGLLEAHGTGTPAGDAAELATLTRFFGPLSRGSARTGLGSVKSMIGHAMPAAGAAGLIKAALAIHHGVLPPTLHCEEPHEAFAATRFRPVRATEPWEGAGPRRAGVSAFGFGGINAHVVLEEAKAGRTRTVTATTGALLAAAAKDTGALSRALESGRDLLRGGPVRVAVVDPTPDRLATAREAVARGERRHGRDGISFSRAGLLAQGGRIAFLFPGVEAVFKPRVADVAAHFGCAAPELPVDGDLEGVGRAVVSVGRLLHAVLLDIGIRPDVIAGHSIGEWTGMVASGIVPEPELERFVASLVPGSLEVPGVVFAAAGCGIERARAAQEGLEGITVSHDNCPHQVIFCGAAASVDTALGRLKAAGVLCQKLPFRSGFHSPAFAPYLAPHRERLARLPLQAARIPLWSATTCAPYPSDLEEVRALAIEHLVRPVRFRELIEALYAEGVRVFVQVGTGSLTGFVEDTLRGRPHLALSANVPQRSGLEQLRRVAGAFFVEGAEVDLGRLESIPRRAAAAPLRLSLGVPLVRLRTVPRKVTQRSAPSPVLAEFDAVLREMTAAQEEVLRAWREAAARGRSGARRLSRRRTLSVEAVPALLDHCFFRQPDGQPIADRYPVVPLTTSISWMLEAARELVPERTRVAVEDVRAHRWLAVAPPVEVTVTAELVATDRVAVAIEGYSDAVVRLADGFPAAPAPDGAALAGEGAPPLRAERLYGDRWMFHGPAFQGVIGLEAVAQDGIRGTLQALPAPGALLDNAGQLLGLWMMLSADVDRLAMPVRVRRLSLFGPEPAAGTRVDCVIRVRELDAREVRADIELTVGGRIWARIEGWEDRRFETDPRLWAVLREPEREALAEACAEGYSLLRDRWRSAQSRDFLMRRYLGEREREEYAALGLRRQRQWLAGRIAAKDAVREWLWRRGQGPIFPVEIEVASGAEGRPEVRGRFAGDLRVSIAHKDDRAAAIVGEARDVGIDLEAVAPLGPGFAETAFTGAERALLPPGPEWSIRFWAAKEAAAKARGTGLGGDPRRFPVLEVAGERLRVGEVWVETRVEEEYVVAWTPI